LWTLARAAIRQQRKEGGEDSTSRRSFLLRDGNDGVEDRLPRRRSV